MPRITPNLWFVTEALQAAELYTSIFPNSRITELNRYPEGSGEQTGKVLRKKLLGIEKTDIPIHKGEPLALELRAFVDCVRNRSEPVVSGEHAAEALQLAVAICQSIRKGQT